MLASEMNNTTYLQKMKEHLGFPKALLYRYED